MRRAAFVAKRSPRLDGEKGWGTVRGVRQNGSGLCWEATRRGIAGPCDGSSLEGSPVRRSPACLAGLPNIASLTIQSRSMP